ncbi:PRC-barrel domain-containing protein [Rhodophyticola porphyridii]|uniref:PRC-barrel domain containing protein n=1 Tax=Rhodophyticola porphyridii TaxID=1852017 RepID=A0A3L9XWC3_9RHOB|nr:PRC-barrel domain-containing protein [Rhodophyticola porphyridii]RMA40819.1 PRC-barrel domain containing protein [Rhodophyticola porphyridii]
MKRFLSTTATAILLGTGAFADAHSTSIIEYEFTQGSDFYASEMIGMRVYSTEAEMQADMTVAADGERDWNDIGEINEVILTEGGDVAAVIVGVGGFLGIGEKDVAVDMSQINRVEEEGDSGNFFLVINASQEMLESAPEFTRAEAGMMATETEAQADAETTSTDMAMAEDRPMLVAPTIEREGYMATEPVDLTSENLTGARVYGINDEDIGEISELLLSDDGQIDRVVIDVGGFLGLGEKPIAVTFEELSILRNEAGDSFRVYIDSTQEALEAQPEYQG